MNQDISPYLIQEARRQLDHPRLASTLLGHCRYLPETVTASMLDTRIHPECQMLAHSLRHHRDAALAVSQYFSVALQQYHTVRQIIDRVFDQPRDIEFLDFACGYGRLLRFLVHSIPPEQIAAAEIQPDAVDYARDRFGVHALPSSERPEDFDPDRRFDMIWVASLFSHLPEGLFGRWLNVLAGLLRPEGILCFSVHDEALLPQGMAVPESGLLYIEGSENAGLSPEIYGTTFVTHDYVRRSVERAFSKSRRPVRMPRLLAHEQDVYVVAAQPDRDLSGLEQFRRGARGWLDRRSVDEPGRLSLKGWAASLDGEPLEGVEVRLDDATHYCPAQEPRPKVAEVLGNPRLSHCGYSCTLPMPAGPAEPYLTVTAWDPHQDNTLLFAGPVRPSSPPDDCGGDA